MIKFGERLKELIKENDTDKVKLSELVGLSDPRMLNKWIRGDVCPSFSYLVKIADYFKCSLDYLIGRTDNDLAVSPRQCPSFIDQIEKIIKEKKSSKYKLIKNKICVSDNFYKWKNLNSQPQVETLVKLADYFDVSIDYLVGRE